MHMPLALQVLVVVLAGLASCAGAGERVFDDWPALWEAAAVANAGDTLVLKDGAYRISEAVTFGRQGQSAGGAERAPVTVRAESVGGCVLTGDSTAFAFKPGSRHVVVSGFDFRVTDETAVKLVGSSNIRVTRCSFVLQETDSFDWLVITGAESSRNRVDHCRFEGKRQPGNYVTIDGGSSGDGGRGKQSQHDRIDHNAFLDIGPRAKNEKEAIRVGQSRLSLSSGHTVIEQNYFARCDGDPEIISIKSCDNTVRFNTIVDCMGVVSLRHGDRSVVRGNVFRGAGRPGCGGVRVCGDDHQIGGNYFVGLTGERFSAALAITNGDADDVGPGKRLSAHFRVRRLEVAGNTFIDNAHSIEIGYARSGKKKAWRKPPQDLLFIENVVVGGRGPLVEVHTPPERAAWRSNRFSLGEGGVLSDPRLRGQLTAMPVPMPEPDPRAPRNAASVGPLAD